MKQPSMEHNGSGRQMTDNCMVVVANHYPSERFPGQHAFVQSLVETFANQEIRTIVIAPQPLFSFHRGFVWTMADRNVSFENNPVIIRPPYMTFGSFRISKRVSSFRWTVRSFYLSVMYSAKFIRGLRPRCVYGHFLYPCGYAALGLSKKLNVPGFFAFGETNANYSERLGRDRVKSDLGKFAGIVAVSNERKNHLLSSYDLYDDQIAVFHNAVDDRVFFPRNKSAMRKQYGFPQNEFIVIFSGHFIEQKGISTLIKSLEKLPDLKGIFLGSGPIQPTGSNVIFSDRVPHGKVPELLSAADLFVLPTLMEGCSNAIQEAMACGLPIVSSNRPFNHEVLDDSFAELIEPTEVDTLVATISRLKSSPERLRSMGKNAFEKSRESTLDMRARKIWDWIGERVRNQSDPIRIILNPC